MGLRRVVLVLIAATLVFANPTFAQQQCGLNCWNAAAGCSAVAVGSYVSCTLNYDPLFCYSNYVQAISACQQLFNSCAAGCSAVQYPGGQPHPTSAVIDSYRHFAVYYIGSNNHVWQLFYDGVWHNNDITAMSGNVVAVNAISGLSSVVDRSGHFAIYYIGANAHVWQLFYDGVWHNNDVSALSGNPVTPILASPISSLIDSSGHFAIYYISGDQHVWQLFYDGVWHNNDITTLSGNVVTTNPGTALVSALDPVGHFAVYYVGINHHIYQLFFDTVWHNNDLNVLAGGAANVTAASALAKAVDSANHFAVYYIGTNNHIWQLFFDTRWHAYDLNALTGTTVNANAQAGLASVVDPVNHFAVYYVGSNNHVWQLFFDSVWHAYDLNTLTSNTVNANTQSGMASVVDPSNQFAVYYVGSNNHVWQLFFDTTWHKYDLTSLTGTPITVR